MTEESEDIQLTEEQEDALVQGRNVAITAGAGTGKTTTLTERYVTILAENPSLTPENIVTITFTRKAAAELTERVREEVYNRLEAVERAECRVRAPETAQSEHRRIHVRRYLYIAFTDYGRRERHGEESLRGLLSPR